MDNLRIGIGYDVHAFEDSRKLVLGGVEIDYRGLAGHSDADVLIHAVIDALLGASGLGDIGKLFPDTDPKYKGISSIILLKNISEILIQNNVKIINIDNVIICEKPKIIDFSDQMKNNISEALNGLNVSRIGIKGKTTEKLGFTGREEGIEVHSVVLIRLS
ncbi:MAG: 2-C-methyl-D-erythritol 2,4-cyclodiphosphate synthase [Spirochaetes bacterium]|nr:2-C-methyl-D-erythritol 2,4-cyclodiphosphate synthase [Spirochaetota bacterium]